MTAIAEVTASWRAAVNEVSLGGMLAVKSHTQKETDSRGLTAGNAPEAIVSSNRRAE
jgi:hypothetical protein